MREFQSEEVQQISDLLGDVAMSFKVRFVFYSSKCRLEHNVLHLSFCLVYLIRVLNRINLQYNQYVVSLKIRRLRLCLSVVLFKNQKNFNAIVMLCSFRDLFTHLQEFLKSNSTKYCGHAETKCGALNEVFCSVNISLLLK